MIKACSVLIMLCLGSLGIDHVICKLCYKGTILQQNHGDGHNSMVKDLAAIHDHDISISVLRHVLMGLCCLYTLTYLCLTVCMQGDFTFIILSNE